MPGHDKSKIVGSIASDLDEFLCGICKDVLNKPVVTQCYRQSYCRDCVEGGLKRQTTCANDRKSLTVINGVYEVPQLVINVINKMQIKCDYSDKGCPAVTTIGTKVEHVEMCMYKHNKTGGQVTLVSALIEAKSMSESVIDNRHVCPKWKSSLINMCNDAISGFDPNIENGLYFASYLVYKIETARFRTDLTWNVRAHVVECCATTEDHIEPNYSLKLKYNNLVIEMFAVKNRD